MIEKIKELDQDDKKYLEFINRPWMTKKNIEKNQTRLTGKYMISNQNYFMN